MICPRCGKQLKDDVKFCTGCGQKIEQEERVHKEGDQPTVTEKDNVSAGNDGYISNASKYGANSRKLDELKIFAIVILVIFAAVFTEFILLPKLQSKKDDRAVNAAEQTTEASTSQSEASADGATTETTVTQVEEDTSSGTTEVPMEEATEEESTEEESADRPDAENMLFYNYFIADSDTRVIEEGDYSYMTWQELCYAKNEIYARHGYIFKSKELQDVFESKQWYKKSKKFTKNPKLSKIEAKNVETLRKAEMEAGDGSLYPLDEEDQN